MMPFDPQQADTRQTLCSTLLDQPAEQLVDLLQSSPEARRTYIELLHLHAELEWELGERGSGFRVRGSGFRDQGSGTRDRNKANPMMPVLSEVEGSAANRRGLRSFQISNFGLRIGFAVAALLVVAATVWFLLPAEPRTPNPEPSPTPPASVATLTSTNNATFADTAAPMQLGGQLPPGPIQLTSGSAQLMFASTAMVDLHGPCEFEMTGPNRGRLTAGSLEAFVPERAHGFTVDLPGGARVVDRGTAFIIKIDHQSRARIHVFEGQVELQKDHIVENLLADQAMWFDPATGLIARMKQLELVNGGFDTGDLTGWVVAPGYGFKAPVSQLGVIVSATKDAAPLFPPDKAGPHHIVRLGHKDQAVSLRKQTSHRIEPGADYTVAVRARAHDTDGAATFRQHMQSIVHDGEKNVVTDQFDVDGQWRWRLTHVPADVLRDAVGQPLELRLYKHPDKNGNHVWVDQVQLWINRPMRRQTERQSPAKHNRLENHQWIEPHATDKPHPFQASQQGAKQ